AGRQGDRAHEASRPASGEQLLRVGAVSRATGGRQFDVEASVTGPGGAVAAAGGMRPGRVQHLFNLAHGSLLFSVGDGKDKSLPGPISGMNHKSVPLLSLRQKMPASRRDEIS